MSQTKSLEEDIKPIQEKRQEPITSDSEEEIGPQPIQETSDMDVGPLPSESRAVEKKKRKVLVHEHLFLKDLPKAEIYEASYMHKQPITLSLMCRNEFLITASTDGHIKFWKKTQQGIQFVKNYKASNEAITGLSLSPDGHYLASISADKSVRIFDVLSFDMINMLKLSYIPGAVTFAYKSGDAIAKLVISDKQSHFIYIYDCKDSSEPLEKIGDIHKSSITCMVYHPKLDMVISADQQGFIEYWSMENNHSLPENLKFQFKGPTDLYEFKKNKSYPTNIQFSNDFELFSTTSFTTDRQVRIWNTLSGKMIKKYDERLQVYQELQQAGSDMYKLDTMEYGRRLVVEKEWLDSLQGQHVNAVFDYSGNFIMYPSMLGIKVINIYSNKLVKLIGKNEPIRFLNIALYQGNSIKRNNITINMMASNNPLIEEEMMEDPTIFASGFKRNRFYLFSNREPNKNTDRDIFNEKPTREERSLNPEKLINSGEMGTKSTIHTSEGDIHLLLYPIKAPKTVLNYSTLAKKGYYDQLIFHRVIKSFMIQTGCPLNDGTGGDSIFKKEFEDEFDNELNFNQPYMLAMANAGPNTNLSQFFITSVKCDWLNNKHTIFGKVTGGYDVVHRIENAKVDRLDRPLEEIKIISIDIK